MGISYSRTGSTLKIRFRHKGGNLETLWIAYWKGGYLAKIPREGGTWKSGIPKGGNPAISLEIYTGVSVVQVDLPVLYYRYYS